MIDTSIDCIAEELNQFLIRKFNLDEDVVVVSNLVEQDGTLSPQVNNKVVISLVNIEKDVLPYQPRPKTNPSYGNTQRAAVKSPPAYFNIYLVFASHFSGGNYHEGLKFISSTVSFFQGRPVFNRANSPSMAENIECLTMELENLSINDLSNLWGMLSGKYLPSVLYRVRMVTLESESMGYHNGVISDTQTYVGSK